MFVRVEDQLMLVIECHCIFRLNSRLPFPESSEFLIQFLPRPLRKWGLMEIHSTNHICHILIRKCGSQGSVYSVSLSVPKTAVVVYWSSRVVAIALLQSGTVCFLVVGSEVQVTQDGTLCMHGH